MATTFTSYTDLKTAMQNALADFVANRIGTASFTLATGSGASRQFSFTSIKEFREGLALVDELIANDAATSSGTSPRRAYAGFAGRR